MPLTGIKASAHQTFDARFDVMGTWAHVVLVGGDIALLEDARSRLETLDALWDRFDSGSDIARLNEADGEAVKVSAETQLLVGLAVQAWDESGGRFDPTVLDALLAAGYDRADAPADPRTRRRSPGHPTPGCDGIVVDVTAGTVTVPRGVHIDVDGIAKGLAADLTAQAAIEAGVDGVCVNVGGDLRLMGLPPREDGWVIDVATPDGSSTLGSIRLFEGAVATTSRATRTWGQAHAREHHIIDPLTGGPASSGLLAASVVVEEGWRAEVLATTVFLSGADATMRLLDEHDAAGLLVADDGTLLANAAWRDLL